MVNADERQALHESLKALQSSIQNLAHLTRTEGKPGAPIEQESHTDQAAESTPDAEPDSSCQIALPSVASPLAATPVATLIGELISRYEKTPAMPSREFANENFLTLQRMIRCAPSTIECASYQFNGARTRSFNPADLFCTFYFVEDQKRIYAILHDDYRGAVQCVIVSRDHDSGAAAEFSARALNISPGRSDFEELPSGDAERLYRSIGDLHQGSERVFLKAEG